MQPNSSRSRRSPATGDRRGQWAALARVQRSQAFQGVDDGQAVILGRRTFESLQRRCRARNHRRYARSAIFARGRRIARGPSEALEVARRLAKALAVDEIMVAEAPKFSALSWTRRDGSNSPKSPWSRKATPFSQPRHGSMARNQARNPAARRKGRADFAFVTLVRQ